MIYPLVRAIWRAGLFAFFRRIDVQGRERVPARGPVLLVSNHANAFVDPLLVLTRLERTVSLTAKSTLRRNPLLGPLIRALHVIEFHRSQDREAGADPAANADAMEACRRRLAAGGAVVVFPEGVSHSDPGLRPFRTGAARIALDFVAAGGASLPVVPVGLHYDAKERFRSAAGVAFGAPFDAAAWLRAHPGAGPRELTGEMERRIRALVASFGTEEEVRIVRAAAEILRAAGSEPAPLDREPPRDLAGEMEVIHRLRDGRARLAAERPEALAALEARVDEFDAELRRLGVSAEEVFLPIDAARAAFFVVRELEVLVVGLPLAAWGWVNHLPLFHVLRTLVRRMSTDRDHVASNAVFLGMPVVPFFYALQTGLVALLASPWWALPYALSLPLSAAVVLLWRDRVGGIARRVRTFLRFARRPALQRRLRAEAEAIAGEMRRLADELRPAPAASPSAE